MEHPEPRRAPRVLRKDGGMFRVANGSVLAPLGDAGNLGAGCLSY